MQRGAIALAAAGLLLGSAIAAARPAEQVANVAADTKFVRGVALGLFATDSDWDYGPLVTEIADRGATDVLIVVNAYQSNRFTSDIQAMPGRTPMIVPTRQPEKARRMLRGTRATENPWARD